MRNLVLIMINCLALVSACSDSPAPVALGTLERDRITLRATVGEIIRDQPAPEGSRVRAGETLVVLDDTLQQQAVNSARSELAGARARLDRLRNGFREEEIDSARARVSAAEAELLEAERNHERLQVVARREFVPRAELDNAETRRDNRQARLEEARHQLTLLLNGSRGEDIAEAEAQVEAREAALAAERHRLAELQVKAPRDGLLETLPWETGERVSAGTGIAILLVDDAPHARVYVPEPYRRKVSVGTRLRVFIDGREAPMTGEVRWIDHEAAFTTYYALNREERSRLMYLAEIRLPESAADLPAGLPAQAELPE